MTGQPGVGGLVVRRFSLLDSRVELEVPTSEAALLDAYPADDVLDDPEIHISARPAPGGWAVVSGTTTFCEGSALPGVLLSAVNGAVLARTSYLAVHAGVVAVEGRNVAFPGRSGVGKSTLTAACLRRGCDYLSDEALCLDPETALVHPFPRPLALDARSWSLLADAPEEAHQRVQAERIIAAEEFGARSVSEPSPLHEIVLPVRGSDRLELGAVPRGDAIAALLRHAFNHYRMPVPALDVVHRVVAGARVWRLSYSDPLAAAALLRTTLTRAS